MPPVDDPTPPQDESAPAASPWAVPGPTANPYAYPQHQLPYPGPYGWQPVPPSPQGYNGFAVASGILGLLCGCLWPLTVGLAITALVQIPRRNQKGRWMAVTALVLTGVWIVVGAFAGLLSAAKPDFRSGPTHSRSMDSTEISEFDLRPGDCFDRGTTTGRVELLSGYCSKPHEGEAFGQVKLTFTQYPGHDLVKQQASDECERQRDAYTIDDWLIPASVEWRLYLPNEASWKTTEANYATCVYYSSQPRTGSLRFDATMTNDDQRLYLSTSRQVDRQVDARPDGNPADHPREFRTWAGRVSDELDGQIAALEGHHWLDHDAQPMPGLIAELKQARDHWHAAQESTDASTLAHELTEAAAHPARQQVRAARTALDLTTERPLHSDQATKSV